VCSFPRLVPKINILSRCNLVPERHGRMAPCANGLAAFGGGLPPSHATREQDAAGAGALKFPSPRRAAQDRGMPSGLFEVRVYHLGTGRSTRLRRHRDAK